MTIARQPAILNMMDDPHLIDFCREMARRWGARWETIVDGALNQALERLDVEARPPDEKEEIADLIRRRAAALRGAPNTRADGACATIDTPPRSAMH